MKEIFHEYYQPSQTELKCLWDNALLVFDTKALYSLVYCLEETARVCIDLLDFNRERLWLPYHVAMQYHQGLDSMITREEQYCRQALNFLKVLNDCYDHYRGLFFTDTKLDRQVQRLFGGLVKHFAQKREQMQQYNSYNPIKALIAELFEDKVGEPYPQKRLEEIYAAGEERSRRKAPPLQSAPVEEDPLRKYGGLITWMQVMDKAQTSGHPLLLISGDDQSCWFINTGGKDAEPHPYLLSELKSMIEIPFYICTFYQFLSKANAFFDAGIQDPLLEEMRLVSRRVNGDHQGGEYGETHGWMQRAVREPKKSRSDRSLPAIDKSLLGKLNNLMQYYTSQGVLFNQIGELLGDYERNIHDDGK